MANLTVGQGKQFSTISGAIAASRDGDVISIDAGTYTNDFATINTKITLEGVGGMVKMVATAAPPNGKGILVTNTDVTINGLEFTGTKVPDGNGAGIRYQAGHLTINNSYFHHNENGILANPNTAGSITIRNSEFSHNGKGDGYTHNLYVGKIGSLTIDNSYFHDAAVGHQIKSRALVTTITNSRIAEGQGNGSYSIDLPNGGQAKIHNNMIEQGARTGNPVMVSYGVEGGLHASNSLEISGNTISNLLGSPSAKFLWNATTVTATVSNNSVFGLTSSQYGSGAIAFSGMTVLTTAPVLDSSSPWATTAAPAPEPAPAPAPGPAPSPVDPSDVTGTTGNDAITLLGSVIGATVDLGAGNDTLTLSSAGPNTLVVFNAEVIKGGTQADTVMLGAAISGATIDLGAGRDTLRLANGSNQVTVANVEVVQGGTGADIVTYS
uniref:right-handed parallel beta-helix repeat-containing protein n=1 Tax=Sabulicella rubraurantiaca TaxID=2811429 RepID=UPI001A965ECD